MTGHTQYVLGCFNFAPAPLWLLNPPLIPQWIMAYSIKRLDERTLSLRHLGDTGSPEQVTFIQEHQRLDPRVDVG